MSSPQKHRFALTVELLEKRELLSASGMGILVPAYQYPTTGPMWSQLASAASTSHVPIMAILNPGSGPGTAYDPSYGSAVDTLRAAGGKVIGYVPTWYGDPSQGFSLAQAETEINEYKSWYHLDGIFLDQLGTNDSVVSAYQSLYSYIKSVEPSWTVVANPGTAVDQVYGNGHTADTFVTFEHSVNADAQGPAFTSYTPPAWAATAPSRLANIVNDVTTQTQMQAVVQQAVNQHAGWIYVNNDTSPYPSYGQLPAFWSAELLAVASDTVAAAAKSSSPTSFVLLTNGQLEEHNGSGWTTLTTGIAAICNQGVGTNGKAMVDAITTTGAGYEYHDGSGWVYLDTSVASAVAGHGVSYVLLTNGYLYEYNDASATWTYIDNGISSISAGTDANGSNAVDAVFNSGAAYEHSDSTGWHLIASSGVRTISGGPQGIAVYITTSGDAYQYNQASGTSSEMAAGVEQVTAGTDQNGNAMIDLLFSSGSLYEYHTGSGWALLASGVQSIAKGRAGLIDAVFSNGNAYEHAANGAWNFLTSSVRTAV